MIGDQSGTRLGWWRKLTAWYAWLLSQILVVTVGILVVPVSLQVFSRYTHLIPSYIWTEELARFMFVWSIMIGAILGVREMTHFEVDVLPRMGPRADAAMRLFTGIFTLVFALVFVIYGWEFTVFGWNRISELAELPLWTIHVAWPLCGVSWLIFHGENMYDNVRTLLCKETQS